MARHGPDRLVTWQPPGGDPASPPGGPPPLYPPGQYGAPYPSPGYWAGPPRPGIIPLRPLGLGEILDGAFTCIRQYPRATLGLSAVIITVSQLAQLPFTWLLFRDLGSIDQTRLDNGTISSGELSHLLADFAGILVVNLVIGGIALLLLTGMLTVVVGKGVLGRPVTIGEAWQEARPRLGRLFLLVLTAAGLVSGIFMAGLLPGILLAVAGGGGLAVAVIVIGMIASVAGFAYVFVVIALATPALILEKVGVGPALRHSRELVRGAWWRTFGVLLLATILTQVIASVLALPFSLAGGGFSSIVGSSTDTTPSFWQLLITSLGGIVAGTVTRPFSAGVLALLYVDRRMRAEGLDVTLVASAASSGGAGAP